jgi:hypothetical protein
VERLMVEIPSGDPRNNVKDDVLWTIEAPTARPFQKFTIGVVPKGFVEGVPLREDPMGFERISVSLRTSEAVVGMTFSPSGLRPGEIFLEDEGFLPESTFRENALASCD